MTTSSEKATRKAGDVVMILAHVAGFGGVPGRYRIDKLGEPKPCMICDEPDCQEWPNLERLGDLGNRTGEYAYHVSECEMTDAH